MNLIIDYSDSSILKFVVYFCLIVIALTLGRFVSRLVEKLQGLYTESSWLFIFFHVFILISLYFMANYFLTINSKTFEDWTHKSTEGLIFGALFLESQLRLYDNFKNAIT